MYRKIKRNIYRDLKDRQQDMISPPPGPAPGEREREKEKDGWKNQKYIRIDKWIEQ